MSKPTYEELEEKIARLEKEYIQDKNLRDRELSSLLDNIPGMVYQGKDDWTAPLVIHSEELCGYTPEELNFKKWTDIVHPDDVEEFKAKNLEFQEGLKEETIQEYRIITKSGEIRHVHDQKIPILTEKNEFRGVYGIVIDVTKHKECEEERIKYQKLKSLGVLAGGIAHDFNNVLTAIRGNLELGLMSADKDSKVYEYINRSLEASDRATKIGAQLIIFSKGGTPIKTSHSIDTLLIDMIKTNFDNDSRIKYDSNSDLKNIDIDGTQISIAICNIVQNSLEAIEADGNINISTELVNFEKNHNILPSGKYLKIVFEDDGKGIDDAEINNIFDPYYTTKSTGKGLGLTTSFSIINAHKGYIQVNSEVGKGTKFSVYLPYKEEIMNQYVEKADYNHKNKKILVLEDEEMVSDLLKTMLTHIGHIPEITTEGSQAVKLYKERFEEKKPFDLVIMDLIIQGGMGGEEAARRTLEYDPHAKLIVSSGYSNNPVIANYRDYGFQAAIPKPFNLKDLEKTINMVLNIPEI
jgi:PAS domain S-box-containing protein